jgi:hypothetical protein
MRTLRISAILVAIVLVLTTHGNAQDSDASRDRAIALWEEAIQAKGGREKLHSVQNLVISSSYEAGTTTETERLYAMPNRAWIYLFNPAWKAPGPTDVFSVIGGNDLTTRRLPASSYNLRSTALALHHEVKFLIQEPLIYLMETRWVRPRPTRARVERNGKDPIDVIETDVNGLRVDFFLDPKTRLPFKLVTGWFSIVQPNTLGTEAMEVELDGYRDVDGIQMPRSVTRVLGVGRDFENARYRINVEYNPDIFDGVQPRIRKAEDWKPVPSEKRRERLIDDLKSKDEVARTDARRKLIALGDDPRTLLTSLLNTENGDEQVYVAAELLDIDAANAAALGVLRGAVQKSNGSAMIQAAQRIAVLDPGSDFTIAPLVKEAQKLIITPTAANLGNQRGAAFALALTAPGVRALAKLLEHRDSWVRQAAVLALDERTETWRGAAAPVREAVRECIPALVNALADGNEVVRGMADESLSQIGPEAIPFLRNAVASNNAKVSAAAARALATMENPRR